MKEIEKINKKASELLSLIQKITADREICKKVGEVAMGYIADYPLYASCSNISYNEAIALAFIVDGGKEIEEAYFKAKFEKSAVA